MLKKQIKLQMKCEALAKLNRQGSKTGPGFWRRRGKGTAIVMERRSMLSFGFSRRLVGAIGFEPTTPCAQGRCATRLRYAPTFMKVWSDYIEIFLYQSPGIRFLIAYQLGRAL